MQAKAVDKKCERLMQEIVQREREETRTKVQLRELQETLHDLEDRLNLTENDNRNLFAKLKKSEVEVEQEVYEKVNIIETLEGQVTYYERTLKETEEQLKETKDKLIEKDLGLKAIASKLDETQVKFKETETNLHGFEEKLIVTQTDTNNLKSSSESM